MASAAPRCGSAPSRPRTSTSSFPSRSGRSGDPMRVPIRQSMRMAAYLMEQKLRRREKFPLLVELEPLFQCNLECAGCGKIQQPDHVLRRRMPVQQAVAAIEESGAPMVSIAGGEPLIHPEIDEI